MRFFELSATALAATALLPGAMAQAPAGYGPKSSSLTSATTVYYSTRTVLRVVETLTATRNGTTSAFTSTSSSTVVAVVPTTFASATGSIPSYGNVTSIVLGTGAGPSASFSASAPGYSGPPSTGAADKVGVQALGFATFAGLVALLMV